jgi:long-chain-fatty-acid--CoA ligase ACSBG
MGTSTIM